MQAHFNIAASVRQCHWCHQALSPDGAVLRMKLLSSVRLYLKINHFKADVGTFFSAFRYSVAIPVACVYFVLLPLFGQKVNFTKKMSK